MASLVRRLEVLSVASCLFLSPPLALAASEPTSCPGAGPDDSDEAQLRRCLEAARAGDERSRALFSRNALRIARRLYVANRDDAEREWLEGYGDVLVHYGTEGCEAALAFDATGAAGMLDSCINLLGMHFLDLSRAGAANSAAAEETAKRRASLTELRQRLPKTPPAPPPPAHPPGLESGSKNSEVHAEGEQPHEGAVVAPPKRESSMPTDTVGQKPRGLLVGAGISGGLTLVSAVLLGMSWSYGQRAHDRIRPPGTVTDTDIGLPICDLDPGIEGCAEHAQARRLFVGSAISLGVATVATTVFGALLVRHYRQASRRRTAVFAAPQRTGFLGGISFTF